MKRPAVYDDVGCLLFCFFEHRKVIIHRNGVVAVNEGDKVAPCYGNSVKPRRELSAVFRFAVANAVSLDNISVVLVGAVVYNDDLSLACNG